LLDQRRSRSDNQAPKPTMHRPTFLENVMGTPVRKNI